MRVSIIFPHYLRKLVRQKATTRAKAAEKRKKVSKKAAARSTKHAKPNDAADGYDDKSVEDVIENPVDANEGVLSN